MPRWFWGALSAIIYLELAVIVSVKIKLPEPPEPVFQEPTPVIEYQWTKGPYDDDWDFCWTDETNGQYRCWQEDI